MGMELSMEVPLTKGRSARFAGRDATTANSAIPDRIRDPGNFAAVFQNGVGPRSAILPQPDPRTKTEKTDPGAETDRADAFPADPDDAIKAMPDPADWLDEADSVIATSDHGVPTQDLLPLIGSDPGERAQSLVAAPVPFQTGAAEWTPDMPHLAGARPDAAGARQSPVSADTALPVQIATATSASAPFGSMKWRALPGEAAVSTSLAPNPKPASATTSLPVAQVAGLSPPLAVATHLQQPLGSAAASRFSAALADGTTQRHPPTAPNPALSTDKSDPIGPKLPKFAEPDSAQILVTALPANATTPTTNGSASSGHLPTVTEQQISTITPFSPALAEPARPRTDQRRLAAHIGAQLLQAASTNGPNTELQLNPVELGRVRLSLQAMDSTITVAIIADRPETADLMRRHVDTLAQEFRSLGYQDVNVSVGQRQAGTGQGATAEPQQGESGQGIEPATELSPSPTNRPGLSTSGSLDLRL